MTDRLDRRPPLYAEAERILTRRIADGVWPPGSMIPPEPALAAELGVSPGTIRKALDALERRDLIERRQGRGTFVAAQTSTRARFHFFRVVALKGEKVPPTAHVLDHRMGEATAEEASLLGLPDGAPVHRIRRSRRVAGTLCMLEDITLPEARFPGFALEPGQEMTEEVYVIYQRLFGVTIGRAEERLGAVAAPDCAAALLGLPQGAPMLEISRIAFDIEDRAVELRLTLLDTAAHRYLSELS